MQCPEHRIALHGLRGDSANARPLAEAKALLITLNAELQASGTDQLDVAQCSRGSSDLSESQRCDGLC